MPSPKAQRTGVRLPAPPPPPPPRAPLRRRTFCRIRHLPDAGKPPLEGSLRDGTAFEGSDTVCFHRRRSAGVLVDPVEVRGVATGDRNHDHLRNLIGVMLDDVRLDVG